VLARDKFYRLIARKRPPTTNVHRTQITEFSINPYNALQVLKFGEWEIRSFYLANDLKNFTETHRSDKPANIFHHGLLSCGMSIPECFLNNWLLQRGCEVKNTFDKTG
jgi:hypothetical protein